jgi:hypothetical protein
MKEIPATVATAPTVLVDSAATSVTVIKCRHEKDPATCKFSNCSKDWGGEKESDFIKRVQKFGIGEIAKTLKGNLAKAVENLLQCAANLGNLGGEAILRKDFTEVNRIEEEMDACCELDDVVGENVFRFPKDRMKSNLQKVLDTSAEKCRDLMATSLKDAEVELTHIKNMLQLRRIYSGNAEGLDKIHRRLNMDYENKVGSFKGNIESKLNDEKFGQLADMICGASGLQHQQVSEGRQLVIDSCTSHYREASDLLHKATVSPTKAAMHTQFEKIGVLMSWFDRATELNRALPEGQFKSLHDQLKTKMTALMTQLGSICKAKISQYRFVAAGVALLDLEMFIYGIPAESQQSPEALELKATLESLFIQKFNSAKDELGKALEAKNVNRLNTIMGGISLLKDSDTDVRVDVEPTARYDELSAMLQTFLEGKCNAIKGHINAHRFQHAIDDMLYLAQMRTSTWVAEKLWQPEVSDDKFKKRLISKMKDMLDLGYFGQKQTSDSDKKAQLRDCEGALPDEYEEETKNFARRIRTEISETLQRISRSKDKRALAKIRQQAKDLAKCIAVLPEPTPSDVLRARDMMYDDVKLEMQAVCAEHKENLEMNRFDGVEKTRPFLEEGRETLLELAKHTASAEQKQELVDLSDTITGSIEPEADLVADIANGWASVEAMDFARKGLPVENFRDFLVDVLRKKQGYIKTLRDPAIREVTEDKVMKHLSPKIDQTLAVVNTGWEKDDFESIAVWLENLRVFGTTMKLHTPKTKFGENTLAVFEEATSIIERKADELEKEAASLCEEVLTETSQHAKRGGRTFKERFDRVNYLLGKLTGCEEHILPLIPSLTTPESVLEIITARTRSLTNEFLDKLRPATHPQIHAVVERVIKLFETHAHINHEQVEVTVMGCIGEILDMCKKKSKDKSLNFGELGALFQSSKYPNILEFPQFKARELEALQSTFASLSFKDALTQVKEANEFSDEECTTLANLYQVSFKSTYEGYVTKYGTYGKPDPQALARIVLNAYASRGSGYVPQATVKLLAGVFAVWSLTTAIESDTGSIIMKKPLYLQILAIFSLLGLKKEPGLKKKAKAFWDNSIVLKKSHLIQILTGQGKSITLGVLSTTLAILGYGVSCVCYSEYLSERDEEAFEKVFECFQVRDQIMYGNFQKACEHQINKNGDVREQVRALLEGKPFGKAGGPSAALKGNILLIDEVDVFFSDEFNGNTYSPSATIQLDEIASLQKATWAHRKKPVSQLMALLKGMKEYSALMARGEDSAPIYSTQIVQMVQSLKRFLKDPQEEPYKVIEHKIAYQTNMTYSTKIVFGYRTLWAYFREYDAFKASGKEEGEELNQVNTASLEASLGFDLNCGSFSFAEIPKRPNFDVILGVTGTLDTLPSSLKKTIRDDYGIKGQTLMPSIFGSPNLDGSWEKNVRVHKNQANHWQSIQQEIMKCQESGQPAIVFFESEADLKDFGDSAYCTVPKDSWVFASTPRIHWHVQRATRIGQVTLFSRAHGRGIDFSCRDEAVEKLGGVCVIQTFFSEELSEETQIKGRTARADRKGVYCLTLLEDDITQKFAMTKEELDDLGKGDQMYAELSKKREFICDQAAATREEAVKCAKVKHTQYLGFQRSLATSSTTSSRSECLSFLRGRNVSSTASNAVRVAVYIDGTGSMYNTLSKTKARVSDMFARTKKICEDNGFSDDSFELQIGVYRNYNARTAKELLQVSTWESSPEKLEGFLADAPANYGLGEEAVELGLAHANKEWETKKVDLVIILGDIGPNTRADVDEFRSAYSGQAWARNAAFKTAAYWDTESDSLIQKGTTICCFLVSSYGGSCPAPFEAMATKSGGMCDVIDVNDAARGAEILTNAVSKRVLDAIGGSDLVDAYEADFEGASYRA